MYSVYHSKFAWPLHGVYSGLFVFDLHMFKDKYLEKNPGLLNLAWIGRDRDSFQCKTEGGFTYTDNNSPHLSQKCHPPHLCERSIADSFSAALWLIRF